MKSASFAAMRRSMLPFRAAMASLSSSYTARQSSFSSLLLASPSYFLADVNFAPGLVGVTAARNRSFIF